MPVPGTAGVKKYMSYQLNVEPTQYSAERRYKHFAWLYERLVEKYPGCVREQRESPGHGGPGDNIV